MTTEPRRRDRRSREDVERGLDQRGGGARRRARIGRVTVRDIATRAGVNTTFVHRYFGSKRNLMRAAMGRAQDRLAMRIGEVPDVVDGAAAIVHATLQSASSSPR